MKKLVASAFILLGSLSTFTAAAQVQNDAAKATAIAEEYSEIKIEEVPAVAIEALKKSFPEAKLVKAYINEKKEYKLEVEVGDKVGSLFIDGNGKWIK